MDYLTALNEIINRGIAAAQRDYMNSPHRRDAAIAGFESCRNKSPDELEALRKRSELATTAARIKVANEGFSSHEYWKIRTFEAEIEWTCNCISVILMNQKAPSPFPRSIGPTARAATTVADFVGVSA